MKSSVYPGTRKRTTRMLNLAYKKARRYTGIDPVKESHKVRRKRDEVLYRNLRALSDPEKKDAMVAYLNMIDTEHLKRMRKFFEVLMRYSYAMGEHRAVGYLEPFVTDADEEKKRLAKKMKTELQRGKGED